MASVSPTSSTSAYGLGTPTVVGTQSSTGSTSTTGTTADLATNNNNGFGLGLSGLASGFDWQSLVTQLLQVEREPETLLQQQQATLQSQNSAYSSIVSQLIILQSDLTALNDPTLFASRVANVSDSTVATATASSSALAGTYSFVLGPLATAAVQVGGGSIGAPLNSSSDVSGLVLSNAAFATPVTGGTFTVNGDTVTIATTDTLQQVFDKISAATVGSVTASYDPLTDKITLSSSGSILLGSAGDTSNFLQVARLGNSDTGTSSSSAALGSINQTAALDAANFATTVTDGGGGAGAFTINGVTINYNASTDSLATIIGRINASSAGVTANYDSGNNRLTLTNNSTGDMGVALQDVTGNFLAATKLSTGTLQRGTDLTYSVNGGPTLSSQSNIITSTSSGITGLTVDALKSGSVSVQVATDTNTIQTSITTFVSDYNKLQSMISSLTATTTDSSGNVTPGTLTGDYEIETLASNLRSQVFSQISGLSGSINQLSQLGYETNGNDNTLALTDSSALTNALTTNLNGVSEFFTDATNGLATTLTTTINDLTDPVSGTLVSHENVLTQESNDITNQINAIELRVQADQQRMVNEFTAMETAEAQINQELSFLSQQNFGSSG